MPENLTLRSDRNRERSPAEDEGRRRLDTDGTCPECRGELFRDGNGGEKTCDRCGLVVEEHSIDRGPEWRAFTDDERADRRRVGAPTTELIHDKGLSTLIGWQNRDAHGRSISARERSRLRRLRTWDERYRTKDWRERNLKYALGEISRMASALGLPETVSETAAVIYRRAVEEDLLLGRSTEGMTTAALYAASRQQGLPRSLAEFATVSRAESVRIQRTYRYLTRELGLEIEPEDPARYLPKFAAALEVSDEAEAVSRDLLSVARTNAVHSGKSPAGLAAAAIYAATYLTNERLTQERVSEVSNVSKVTIRNRYQELLEVYADHGE